MAGENTEKTDQDYFDAGKVLKGGNLTSTYNTTDQTLIHDDNASLVAKVHENEKVHTRHEREIRNNSNGDNTKTSFIPSGAGAAHASEEASAEKQKKEKEKFRELLEEQLRELELQIARTKEEIKQLEKERLEILDDIDRITARMVKDENGEIDWAHYFFEQ